MRRRIRFAVDLVNSLLRAPARARSALVGEEERSANEVKRRLEETRVRLKRERPPMPEDG